MRRIMTCLIVLSILIGPWIQQAPGPVLAETVAPSTLPAPDAPTDIPFTLVPSGVWTYSLAAPKIFWNTGVPACPPPIKKGVNTAQVTYPETVSRIATYGSTVRTIYSKQVNCSAGEILSNVVADADYVYWLTAGGLYRTSTSANPGDVPQLVNALLKGPGELAMGSDRIFALYLDIIGPTQQYVGYVTKDTHQLISDAAVIGNGGTDFQSDGTWMYYLKAGSLYRVKPGIDVGVVIATGATGYYPEGSRLTFCSISPPQCFFSNLVFIGKSRSIYRYDNNTGTLSAALYTSGDTTAQIESMVTDGTRMLFAERRTITCGIFNCFTYALNRATRAGASPGTLYTYAANTSGLTSLTTDGTYLFFQQDDGSIQRLPNDASTLPSINMSVTGMEVTQGIQNLADGVPLIKNKHTFVRVYVQSAGPAVSGVSAQLEAPALGVEPLAPVNPAGTKLTVRVNPDRNDINQSFLFELPWSWTQAANLTLHFTLNPYKVPLEPNYSDNELTQAFTFLDSPSLSVEFFRLNYTIGGKTYSPRIFDDIQKTYSWILRAYPLGGGVGDRFKPRIWNVAGGTQLGNWVNQSDPACKSVYGNPGDDVSLCASYFTNGWLYYYRQATSSGDLNVGLNPNSFYYGMISDAAGFFPRGQAMYTKTSVGPAGIPGAGSWDTDGSYADWYAAHEIGHSLGRSHPNAGSDNPATSGVYENCGHSRSDPSFPYGNTSTARAPIGPADNSMEGFDTGDPVFGIKPAVLPSSIWNDVMSYCSNQWISDYTYLGMYTYMLLHPSSVADNPQIQAAQTGDFLVTAGAINTNTNKAAFSIVRRTNSVGPQPTITQGDYALRLLNASNGQLGADQFLATTTDDLEGMLNFGRVVNFLPGTRKLQLVRVADNAVLATYLISANAPTVSNVALVGAPNPVSGVVSLAWTANDADGDPLTFDISYTRDNGLTWQPIAAGLDASPASIDTAVLGGSGTARLRVIASDGANTGSGDSAAFVMANKPPQPSILEPANNLHIHYGQLVNFNGMALDAQDGTVAANGLVWKDSLSNVLGVGPLISLASLPVGTDVITLQATNSKGLSASTSVTVIVDDDLNLPGPTLSAGPATVGWDIPAGTTAMQTAAISITNTGSGDMNWTATSNAPWLLLDTGSGSVTAGGDPSVLHLGVDPSGIPSGTMLSAQVTIKAASQTIIIPVSLSVGPVRLLSTASPSFSPFFLPMIHR